MEPRRMEEAAEHPIYAILDQDIPEARQHLNDSNVNLEKLAQYCRNNYLQNGDKQRALDETKNFTIQALASVAYQINAFSYHLMQLFDHQDVQVSEMETEVRHLNQTVSVHKEKIARREIGALATTNKPTQRQHKALPPPVPERGSKYVRRPIDYSLLDDVGHGMKMAPSSNGFSRSSGGSGEYGTRKSVDSNIYSVDGSGSAIYGRTPAGKAPLAMTTGTLSRNQARTNMADYRTPVIQPPPLPIIPGPMGPSSHYGPGHLANGLAAVHLQQQQHSQQGQQSPYMDRSERSSINSSGRSRGHYHPDGPSSSYSTMTTVPNSPSLRASSTISSAHSPQPQQSHYGTRSQQQQPVFQYPPPGSSNMPPRKLSNGSNGTNGNYGLANGYPSNGNVNGMMSNGSNGHHVIRPQQYSPLPPPPPADLNPGTYSRSSSYNESHTASPLPSKQLQRISQNGHIAVSSPPLPPPPPPPPNPGMQPIISLTGGHLGMNRPVVQHQQQQVRVQEVQRLDSLEDTMAAGDPTMAQSSYLEKVVAVYDYQADKEDELTFMEGQIIYVMKKNDDGWYEGVMDGLRGLFPGNYVEPCPPDNIGPTMMDFPNRHTITH